MKRFSLTTSPISTSFFSSGTEDTMTFAASFAAKLSRNQVIALRGDLGAGKTTFVRGLVQGLNMQQKDVVSSPTFSYLHVYEGDPSLFHFDLYRFRSSEEFALSGLHEYFWAEGISCVEWPERALELLPENTIFIDLIHRGEHYREIIVAARA